ncbi:MAG: type II toxin-antitoxin system HicA family toxin [Clostridia bacterium]|nr:type II toxin-antitoxin system HicA family toxin [Clostridia bacterium]
MGSKYPILKPSEVTKGLEHFGFTFVSQKGSHMKYACNGKTVIIPNHSEVAKGTLKSILKMAQIDLDDFLEIL